MKTPHCLAKLKRAFQPSPDSAFSRWSMGGIPQELIYQFKPSTATSTGRENAKTKERRFIGIFWFIFSSAVRASPCSLQTLLFYRRGISVAV
jgi:hypothetical protein